jgi:hypothetical protein
MQDLLQKKRKGSFGGTVHAVPSSIQLPRYVTLQSTLERADNTCGADVLQSSVTINGA